MVLAIDQTAFPLNIVQALQDELVSIDETVRVFKRPLRPTDENQCIGVFPMDSVPLEESKEMRGMFRPGYAAPTLTRYIVGIHCMIKDGDEERGIAMHSLLTRRMQLRVARSTTLPVALSQLVFSDVEFTERAKKWELGRTRFITAEVTPGSFIYASSTEFFLETESS